MFINMRQCREQWKKLSVREKKFSGNMSSSYLNYPERLASAKVEKVLSLQRNDYRVILLLICHISGF